MDVPYNDESFGGAGDFQSMWDHFSKAEEAAEDLRQDGYRIAHWQTEYRKLVSVHTADERVKGTPVTVTSDLVRGYEDVVAAQEQWLMAEADKTADNHLAYLHEQEAGVLAKIINAELHRPSNQ